MRELHELLTRLRELDAADAPAAMATVARVEGSSYRREGARMLVEPDGRLTGVLTGGCLERDLIAVAGEVLDAAAPRVVTFDLSADDEAYWGTGTGCAGVITLLVEPLDGPRRARRIEQLAEAIERRREVRTATVIAAGLATERGNGETALAAAPGDRVSPAVAESLSVFASGVERIRLDAALAALAPGGARYVELEAAGARCGLLLESLLPPIHLVVVGAERDTLPLLRLAHELGWAATVVEPREGAHAAERIGALARLESLRPGELSGRVELSGRTAVLLATHRYLDDLAYLEAISGAPVGYLGLLGPARRRERLLTDLARRSPEAAVAVRPRLRGPAGLDLGGRAPEQVALAVVAEIAASFGGRNARPLAGAGAAAPGVAAREP
jgi:xanthine dehydrogenase accessory factor